MRVNLQVRRTGEGRGYHVDTLDVYAARSRAAYIKQASVELGLADETNQGATSAGFSYNSETPAR